MGDLVENGGPVRTVWPAVMWMLWQNVEVIMRYTKSCAGRFPDLNAEEAQRMVLAEEGERPPDVSQACRNIRLAETAVLAMLGRSNKARTFLHAREPFLARFLKEHAREHSFLPTMLDVLDNETLAVVHRETGKGFAVTISGVADIFQLHVSLEDELIGDPAPART
jgi:hypothetical protein